MLELKSLWSSVSYSSAICIQEETLCVEIIAYIPACSDEKTMLRKLVTFEEMRLLSVITTCSFGSVLPYDTVCVFVCAACVPERFELCCLHGCCFSL